MKKKLFCYGALTFALLMPASFLSVSAAQNLPTLGDTSREELSPLMERKLGEQIMNSVRRDPDFMDDGQFLNI
jgi:predicted Zn-dependent protease